MSPAQEGYTRPEMLAETEWLAQHLEDPHIRIVDTDTPEAYRRAHIPGAVVLPTHHYLKEPENGLHVMPPEKFAAIMAEMGIGDETLVVAYDGSGSLYAARLWWALNYYGHPQVKVLNGGWNKWLKEGRPITNTVPQFPRASFTPRVQEEFMATGDYLKDSLGRSDLVVLDVRSEAEYTGANPRTNKRAGHIPGAVHLEWLNYITDDELRTFKSASELRAMFQAAGVTPEKEVIVH